VKSPAAVVGMPMYNQPGYLAEALESLLVQSRSDFVIVVVDDSTTSEPAEIVDRYARMDARISYYRNDHRLGMVGNWRRAFRLARKLYPGAPYFAWASDHDVWHPYWFDAMIATMEANMDVVLTYPLVTNLEADKRYRRAREWPDTVGLDSRTARLWHATLNTSAGNAVYGLFRVSALEKAGVFRRVLLPDRLLMAELSLQGYFKQVPEYLWLRRRTAPATLARQRVSLFSDERPASLAFPWQLTHTAVLARELVIRGCGPPTISRVEGLWLTLEYLGCTLIRGAQRMHRHLRRWWIHRRRRRPTMQRGGEGQPGFGLRLASMLSTVALYARKRATIHGRRLSSVSSTDKRNSPVEGQLG
jgi:Glycosyl transferase family 2